MIQKLINALYEYFKENKILDTYTNKNLKEAVMDTKEIMVNCKEYYLVDIRVIKEVNKELDLRWNFL